jgi:muramoyltetrapeptide carboxypeptidase LdcA involved in peptidoglycan recycling
MNLIFADKLKAGDEIRVIAPSRSMTIISQELRDTAKKRFDELGLVLTFGKHVEESDDFASSSIESRIEDLHDAFLDTNVKGILTVIGGFNSNQLLREIDWSIIQSNPKVLCGFSDITALNNSILAKTGLVTYSGVHYSTFGMEEYFEYSYEYFKKCLFEDDVINVEPSKEWTDDAWFMNQHNRSPMTNEGWLTIHEGSAEGRIVGGNLCTLNLLQGTEFMPDLTDSILFIEDDEETNPVNFDRDLVSLIQQPGFSGVKGIVIGRFQRVSKVSNNLLMQIIHSKKELKNIPVIANVDFGHTNPIITYPIGGTVEITVSSEPSIKITRH